MILPTWFGDRWIDLKQLVGLHGTSSPLMNLTDEFFFVSINRPEYDIFFFWVNTCLPLLPACYPWLVEGKRLSLLRGVVFSLWLPSCMGIVS